MERVRANATYRYDPCMLDVGDPPHGDPKIGDLLKVVNLHGCPPCNTMRMCHVNFADSGEFAGLVCVSSLHKRNDPRFDEDAAEERFNKGVRRVLREEL